MRRRLRGITTSRWRERQKRNKYRAIRAEVDGIKFHSKLEARRYLELRLLQRAGEISKLQLQVRCPLKVNDQLICTYIADFVYRDRNNGVHVEDAKGVLTDVFRIKAKLFKAIYNREIEIFYGKAKNNRARTSKKR